MMYLEKDSPKFHYGIGNYDNARDILTHIGRRNGILDENSTFDKKFYKEVKH
jgi:hypothetical protein